MLCQFVLENNGYGRTVDLGGSEAWQRHYRQCIIPSNMGGGQKKKMHGFTINNETQMAFYTSWLAMQGYFGFSYFTPFGFSSVNFNLGEIKTTLQKQVNGK